MEEEEEKRRRRRMDLLPNIKELFESNEARGPHSRAARRKGLFLMLFGVFVRA